MGASTGSYSRNIYRESRRYYGNLLQMSTDASPIPLVDADFNDVYEQMGTALRRALDYAFGNGTPHKYGFNIAISSSPTNNFIVMGGNSSTEGSGRFWLGGFPCLNEDDVEYNGDLIGTALNPGPATRIHHQATLIEDFRIHDTAGHFANNELVGREVQIISALGASTTYTIVGNTDSYMDVAGGPSLLNWVVSGDDWVFYRVNLSTPSPLKPTRLDYVWLDAYLNEVGAANDPILDHNLGGPPNSSVEGARRRAITQRVFVNENNDGLDIPVTQLNGGVFPGATFIDVIDASEFNILDHPILRLGSGRNEELILVDSYTTGGPERIVLKEPLKWRHYEDDYVYPSYFFDADLNRHYVTLLATIQRSPGDSTINSGITDLRETNWGSSQEVRDARLHLGGTLDDAIESRVPFVTVGLGVAGSKGIFNVSDYANAKDCFDAALSSLSSGGVIWVRPGTYVFPDTINITQNNIQIIGESQLAILQGPASTSLFSVQASRFRLSRLKILPGNEGIGVEVTAVNRVLLEDVLFDGGGISDACVKCQAAAHYLQIVDCRFEGGTKLVGAPLKGTPYVVLELCSLVWIAKSQFLGATDLLAAVQITNDVQRVWMDNCYGTEGDYAFILNNPATAGVDNISVSECIFSEQDIASVWIQGGTGTAQMYTFNGCTSIDSESGFLIEGGNTIDLNHCLVLNSNGVGAQFYGTASRVAANSFQVSGAGTNSIVCTGSANVDFYDCRIKNSVGGTGLYIQGTSEVQVNGLEVQDGDYGVRVSGSVRATLKNLILRSLGVRAIWSETNGHLFSNVLALNCGGSGTNQIIFIEGDANELVNCTVRVFSGNTTVSAFDVPGANVTLSGCAAISGLVTNTSVGFDLQGADGIMNHCRAEQLNSQAIHLSGAGPFAVRGFEANNVNVTTGAAVWVEAESTLSDLKIEAQGSSAVRVVLPSGKTCTIDNLSALAVGTIAQLVLAESGRFILRDSDLDGNGFSQDGIEVQAVDSAVLQGVEVRNATTRGIAFVASTGFIQNCRIQSCRVINDGTLAPLLGIFSDDGYEDMIIHDCMVDGSGTMRVGINAAGLATTVEGCHVKDCANDGITVSNSRSKVLGCYVENTNDFAVLLGSSGSSVSSLSAQNNTCVDVDKGILIRATKCDVSDNQILSALDVPIHLDTQSGECNVHGNKIGTKAGGTKSSAGIRVESDDNLINDNFLDNLENLPLVPEAAILISGGRGNQVENNRINNALTDGGIVVVGGLDNTISGNYIFEVSSEYIRVETTSERTHIEGNTIRADTQTAQIGISIVNSNHCTVCGNRLYQMLPSSVVGAISVNQSSFTKVTGNHVHKSTRGVWSSLSEGVQVSGNTLVQNVNEGILMQSCGRPSIQDNHIEDGTRGIKLELCDNAQVVGNYVQDTSGWGIDLQTSLRPGLIGNYTYQCPAGSLQQWEINGSVGGVLTGNTAFQTATILGDIRILGGVVAAWKPWTSGAASLANLADHNQVNAVIP